MRLRTIVLKRKQKLGVQISTFFMEFAGKNLFSLPYLPIPSSSGKGEKEVWDKLNLCGTSLKLHKTLKQLLRALPTSHYSRFYYAVLSHADTNVRVTTTTLANDEFTRHWW